ncbi:MAG TPA: ABC transporter permease, partial [Terriglobales bacterium]
MLSKIGLGLILLFTLCAVFAPLLAPYSPWQIDLPQRLLTPSAHHWFGTDELGRDILSRTIYGARI